MITGIDHIGVDFPDAAKSATELALVLGRSAQAGHRVQTDNIALVLAEAVPSADAGRPALRLVFAVNDLDEAAHRLARRGLPGTRRVTAGAQAAGGTVDLDQVATHGVALGLTAARTPARSASAAGADVSGLDHVVIRTPDAERAVALYGGRLGLDLRLDRTNPERGNRLLFFVCGDLVVEVSHDTDRGLGTGPDRIWGLAWRAADIDAAHARMAASGVAVSEVRTGHRPGTRVFTVKNHTAGIPTLVIGGAGLARK